jgi:hypothetical protein
MFVNFHGCADIPIVSMNGGIVEINRDSPTIRSDVLYKIQKFKNANEIIVAVSCSYIFTLTWKLNSGNVVY